MPREPVLASPSEYPAAREADLKPLANRQDLRSVAIVTTVLVSPGTPALDATPLHSCGARTLQRDSGGVRSWPGC
jgi:hypothetical protein